MERVVRLHIEKLPEGVYLATSDDIQGLVAQGRTINKTIEIARDVARCLIDTQRERDGAPRASRTGSRLGLNPTFVLTIGEQKLNDLGVQTLKCDHEISMNSSANSRRCFSAIKVLAFGYLHFMILVISPLSRCAILHPK